MKEDGRELKTGKVGLLGRTKSQMDKDALVKLRSEKVEDSLWRVVPEETVKASEYAFVVSAALPERV